MASNQQPATSNIFLIGMMGSWKSTVGRKLAKKLRMNFVDTDDAIEEIMSMKVSEIFQEFGEQRFRDMESSYFAEKSKQHGFIFSTGGGIVLDENNRNILQSNGLCFLLEASPKTLAYRIKNTAKRPLLNNTDDTENRLIKIWNERKEFYHFSAHHIVSTEKIQPNAVVEKILNLLKETDENH